MNSKTALDSANDYGFMSDIFDEFNELKANKKPQKPNSIYYGYGSSYKIIDVFNDKFICLKIANLTIYYETNSTNIKRFLNKEPYSIERLVRDYLGVSFKSYDVEWIQKTEY
ncbi:hypothetical protein [Helicobacter acinonychis]|uniref:hypothetical protein n=1 Tax=Helicobacter acinonychis TaxID=212 RepID=UPI00030D10B2|nr:hypothetical protein [Helicobacter acinonychis]